MNIIKIIVPLVVILIFSSCQKKFDAKEYTEGKADFTKYVATGNSLTQGYQNGGVYEEGQRNSYPSMIAKQMAKVNSNMGEFVQPYFPGNGSGYIHLEWKNDKIQVIKPEDEGGYKEDPNFENISYIGTALNNVGVAGIKLIGAVADPDLVGDNYMYSILADLNPYQPKMFDIGEAANPRYYLQDVAETNPTFFTCWLGNNDILGYGTNGGDPVAFSIYDANTNTSNSFFAYGLSDPQEFRKKYDMALDSLTKNGAKGVVATLPNVTSIPFFNVVKLENIKGSDGALLDIYIETINGVRVAKEGDILLLPVASKLNKFERDSLDGGGIVNDEFGNPIKLYDPTPYGFGPSNPVKNNEVLDAVESSKIPPALAALNNEIRASAAERGIPVVDMTTYLEGFETGITLSGTDYSTKYIEGGVFSLDGVHPNARGYAIVANKFISVINESYESNIPFVNINDYKGIVFP